MGPSRVNVATPKEHVAHDTLTYLSAVLSFLGVLLGLLIVGVFSISDRLGMYRSQAIDLTGHLKRILEIYGESNVQETVSGVPKGVEKAVESIASLLRVTVYFSAGAGIVVTVEMALLTISQTSSSEILGSAIVIALTALLFAVVESVRLVMGVAEMSRIFGKLHSALKQLSSGTLKLTMKNGKSVVYKPEP